MGHDATPADGRRARRERGRRAVIDAMFELLQEGKVPPAVELVAERAGVSVASVFRYFDGLDDLQFQTFERFRERFAPVIAVGDVGDGDLPARIDRLVRSRLDLYERAGAIMVVGRLRALEHAPLVEASANLRGLLADQVRGLFDEEVAGSTPAGAADLVASIDALTALESWDVMRKTHGRSRQQIAHAWTRGVSALIAAWKVEETT
jgi:AcrR family transcriptional regulator